MHDDVVNFIRELPSPPSQSKNFSTDFLGRLGDLCAEPSSPTCSPHAATLDGIRRLAAADHAAAGLPTDGAAGRRAARSVRVAIDHGGGEHVSGVLRFHRPGSAYPV